MMHATRARAAPTAKAAAQPAADSARDPSVELASNAVPVATRWLHVPPRRKRTQPLSQLSPSFYWLLDLGWNQAWKIAKTVTLRPQHRRLNCRSRAVFLSPLIQSCVCPLCGCLAIESSCVIRASRFLHSDMRFSAADLSTTVLTVVVVPAGAGCRCCCARLTCWSKGRLSGTLTMLSMRALCTRQWACDQNVPPL
jgi:hypothetical protein